METRRREGEYEAKGENRRRVEEREREMCVQGERKKKDATLDCSYNRHAFREAIVPDKGFVASARRGIATYNEHIKQAASTRPKFIDPYARYVELILATLRR